MISYSIISSNANFSSSSTSTRHHRPSTHHHRHFVSFFAFFFYHFLVEIFCSIHLPLTANIIYPINLFKNTASNLCKQTPPFQKMASTLSHFKFIHPILIGL
jgi:hypothetical protein